MIVQTLPDHTADRGIARPVGYCGLRAPLPAGIPLQFLSGQVALDAAGNVVGVENLDTQTTYVFDNLAAALAAVGSTFDMKEHSAEGWTCQLRSPHRNNTRAEIERLLDLRP